MNGAILGNGISCYRSEQGATPEIGSEQQVGPRTYPKRRSGVLDCRGRYSIQRCNDSWRTFYLYATQVRGDVSCKPMAGQRTVITGDATFAHAKIVGDVSLSGAEIRRDLDVEAATIDGSLHGSVHENHRLLVGRDFSVVGASISGQLNVAGAKIQGLFNLDNLACRNGLISSTSHSEPVQRTEVGGDIQLNATTISGIAEFDGVSAGGLQIAYSTIQGELRCKIAGGFRTARTLFNRWNKDHGPSDILRAPCPNPIANS